ncbi:T9SS type A sorting domain-containing protein [Roseivirga sp. UBA1976]|uniref:T9SS type A sorting domain-containing protein n=1 Tax=Roseivirga sp. UBA1976 TaxID=1947386 RepID=UPI00257C64D5|nr:T9SS type A sorting domain-containing protein [Roseivirga sp. UBA1976]
MSKSLIGLLLLIALAHMAQAQGVFVSAGSGQWRDRNTWTLVSGSDANGRPDGDDQVTIQSGHTITISNNEDCNVLILQSGTINYSGNRTLTINSSVTATGTFTLSGFNTNHVFDNLGSLTVNSGATLNIGALTFQTAGATSVNGTISVSGSSRTRTFGAVTVNSAGSFLNAGSGSTWTIGGNLTVNNGGTATFNGSSNTFNFLGNVQNNSGGSMTMNASSGTYNFAGNLVNNGTFTNTAYGTQFNFNSASGSISGSGLISLFQANFNSPSNYTNTGNLQIRDGMAGTGAFTNGAGAQLELQNGGPFAVTTFNAAATGNTITYTGYGNPTAFSGNYYNLVLNKSSGNLSFGSSLTVGNDLTIQSGILQVNAVTLNIGNNVNISGGELTPDNASAVVNIGGNMNLSAGEYDHNNGDVNVTGAITVTGGDFFLNGASSTIDAGSVSLQNVSLTLSQGTWTTTGDFNVGSGANVTANGAAISVGGAFNLNAGAANFTGGSLSGNSLYVASGRELFINSVNLAMTGAAELDGTMTFNSSTGTKSVGSVLVNSGGNWNVTQPLNITISGNITNNGTFTGDPGYGSSVYTLTSSSGTIGGSNPLTIRDIVINSPASYTNTGQLTVSNTLTGSGSFINGTGATFTYSGNNSSGSNFTITNFTASATGNTVVWAGTTHSQQWRTTTSTANDYYNVVVNLGTGDYQRLNLVADVRVNGVLTITEGDPVLGSFDLELATGASITGGSSSNWIRQNGSGVVRKYYSGFGDDLSLPIGDNNNYSPIGSFVVHSATLGANPYVEFSVTDAAHPNRSTSNTAQGGDDDGTAAADYISRYWTLTGNDITAPNFSASYTYIDGDVVGTESNLVATLYRQPIGSSFMDWAQKGTVNAVNNTATINNGDNWGVLYAMDNNMQRLPVELVEFKAKAVNRQVKLYWTTSSEVDNSYFEIQRSKTGYDFKAIGTVDGQGSSGTPVHYQFTDQSPGFGHVFYRLKQVDFNGASDYSEVVGVDVVNHEGQPMSVKVYPNPAPSGSYVKLLVEEGATLEPGAQLLLINLWGQVVWEYTVASESIEELDLPQMASGTYVLRIASKNRQMTKRLVVR